MVRDVDPAAGIGVLQPGAAGVLVLLDHDVRHAGLGQAVGGDDAGHPGPHDGDEERPVRVDVVLVPVRRPRVGGDGQLLPHHREVVVDRQAAGHVLEDAAEVVAGRQRRAHAAAVPEADQGLEGERTDGGDLLLAEAALILDHPRRIDAQVLPQQRQVAGDVGEGGQQGGYVRVLERGPDGVVVDVDRLDGSGECHGRSFPLVRGASVLVSDSDPTQALGETYYRTVRRKSTVSAIGDDGGSQLKGRSR